MQQKFIRVYDIAWDTDDDQDVLKMLPTEVTIECEWGDRGSLDDALSDWLSDAYGFCHNGFCYEDVTDRMPGRPTIYAIDFDGTIVSDCWPKIGELNPGFVQLMDKIKRNHDQWILYTMREGDLLEEALEFLKERGYAPDAVNDNTEEMKKRFSNNPRKIYADYYIDDHNMGGLRWN